MKTTAKLATCLDFLQRMSHHLAFKPGESSFKVSAYVKAHAALEAHGSIEDLESVPGIGSGILSKLLEVIGSGKCAALRDAEQYGPPYSVRELTRIPDVGPKRAKAIYDAHGVSSLEELRLAIEAGTFTDAKIVRAYYDMQGNAERISRDLVTQAMEPVLAIMRSTRGLGRVVLPGSYRRERPDIRDIDVLMEVADYEGVPALIETLSKKLRYPITASGARKAYLQMPVGSGTRKLDLNFLETRSWGTGMLHFTGPAGFNQSVRGYAQREFDVKLSQYDVVYQGKRHYFENEKEVFEFLSLPYIIPQHREHHLNITEESPDVTPDFLAGDTHAHTLVSEGAYTIKKLIKSAHSQGLDFIGIADHDGPTGLSEQDARSQLEEIKAVRGKVAVYASIELGVTLEGDLAYRKSTLSRYDYITLALRSQPEQRPLERLEIAFKAGQAAGVPMILAHPTNRVIGTRSEVSLDYYALFKLCKLYGVALEINCNPNRCDLPDKLVHQARQYKCLFAIGSDTVTDDFDTRHTFGLSVARRARLPENEIINATHAGFIKFLNGEN